MRTLSFEAREERRRQVVGLRRLGWTCEAIAEQTGLSRTEVFNICQRYAQEGVRGLKDKRGGRKVGDCRALSAGQEAEVRRLICDKMPDQLKMPFALWNRQAVRQLTLDRDGAALTPQGAGKCLATCRTRD